jgi:uncharacterized OB-fold protein
LIPLSLGQAVAAYTISLVVLLLAFVVGRAIWRTFRSARQRRRRQIQCVLCGTIYEDPSPEPLPRCPNCSRPNERTAPLGI